MTALAVIAGREVRAALRNRWVVAATLLLAMLALALAFLGSAPTGTVGASPLAVTVVSLASLTIFLIPLIALLLGFDAVVGEAERGTLLLLLAYPVARWQVVAGKFLGHVLLLAVATAVGYGAAAAAFAVTGERPAAQEWMAFATLIGTSVLLGAAFLALAYLASTLVRERATAAGLAVGIWLVFVLLFDLALLGWLSATEGRGLSAETFGWLLLLNPADVFRLVNMTGFEAVRNAAGMAGIIGQARLGTGTLLAVLAAWIVLPLALAGAIFARRQL